MSEIFCLQGFQILNPGPSTPPGYLSLAIGLSHLTKSARQTLYIEPLEEGERLNLSKVDSVLCSLKQWRAQVSPHLSSTAPAAPSHRRPIALLHVRYWSAVMLVTRPFLLCNLLRQKQLKHSSKMTHFRDLGKTCIDAAAESLVILRSMASDGLLSSVIMADFYYSLELLQIFSIAYALENVDTWRENATSCLEILQDVGRAGSPKRMLPEILIQLRKLGFISGSLDDGTKHQSFDTAVLDIDSGDELYDL